MIKSRKRIRKQLTRQLRDFQIFEARFINEDKLKTIAQLHGISVSQVSRIIQVHNARYAHTFNYIRKKLFELPPVEITIKDMRNPDVLNATESWIALHMATINYFLKRTYPGTDVE